MENNKSLETLVKNQERLTEIVIAEKGKNLPADVRQILPFLEFSAAKAQMYSIILKKTKNLEQAQETHRNALESGQRYGKAALFAEARIGELYEAAPEASRPGRPAGRAGPTKQEIRGDKHMNYFRDSQTIARHPEAIEEVIKEAEKKDDIPTKTAVLNKIAYQQEKKVKQQLEKNESIMADDARKYLSALRRAYVLISKPPKSIDEKDFPAIVEELRKLADKIKEILG